MRQPWLEPDRGDATGDLFSPASAVVPARRANLAYALAVAVLVAGTTSELASGVLDLPIVPGSETLITVTAALDDAARAIGLDAPHAALRELARRVEALRLD
ncbi:MAG: hypothetical protein AB7P02_15385 [Alphaproteobacteria bacterium]